MSLVDEIKRDIQVAEETTIICNTRLREALEREDEPACTYWKAKAANANGKIEALNNVLDWINVNIIGK